MEKEELRIPAVLRHRTEVSELSGEMLTFSGGQEHVRTRTKVSGGPWHHTQGVVSCRVERWVLMAVLGFVSFLLQLPNIVLCDQALAFPLPWWSNG